MNLQELQLKVGGFFSSSESDNVPVSFGESYVSLSRLLSDVTLCDRSNWGLLKVTGDDRLRFLHNQSTNKIQSLKVGEGCDTVFVNSTGRNIDLVSVYVNENEVLLLVSPQQNKRLYDWMDRYIFPFDKVKITDISGEYNIFTLLGEKSKDLLAEWVNQDILNASEFSHQKIVIDGIELVLTVGNNLKFTGYNLILPQDKSSIIWEKIAEKKPNFIGSETWEKIRILRGRPKINHELTEEFNPLETGLWHTISFDKGCYIGQETIARLNTYKGVKQRLWGIKLTKPIKENSDYIIFNDGEKIGKITSFTEVKTEMKTEYFALGYIRTKAGGEGLQVTVDDSDGITVKLPFVSHL